MPINNEGLNTNGTKNNTLKKSVINKKETDEDIEDILLKISTQIAELESLKADMNSFNINQDEKFFFERKIKPLLDCVYFLALSSNSVANTAQLMQANSYGKKREIRQSIDLSYNMNKEIEEVFEILKKRMELFKDGVEKGIGL